MHQPRIATRQGERGKLEMRQQDYEEHVGHLCESQPRGESEG